MLAIDPYQREIPMPDIPNQLRCEKCGSTHFVETDFKQYLPQYSSAPGGDINSLADKPVKVLVCLCGRPVLPGRLRRDVHSVDENKSFQKSFEAARQFRERMSPEAVLRRIAEPYASKPQHDELAERIAHMETILREPLPPTRATVQTLKKAH
jgi:hypothetical protein